MQAGQVLAGYTLGAADLLRRAMGKKKPEEMAQQRSVFVEGCARVNGMPKEQADRIFDLLAKFAGYGFNKSHAAGYAFLSYVTAYLKANYPVEFIAATLVSETGDSKKLAKFVSEARHMRIGVLRPDVNLSESAFSIEAVETDASPAGSGKAVRFGLSGIRHVGGKASELIVRGRVANGPYDGLLDFLIRNRGTVNRKAAESMIQAGAFDGFDDNRTRVLSGLELDMAKAGSDRLRFLELQTDLFGETVSEKPKPEDIQFDMHQLLSYEKQAFGFYFSSHPLEPYRAEYRAFRLVPTDRLLSRHDGDMVALGGVISARRTRKDRRDRQYMIITLEDFDGPVEVMVFADQLEKHREHLMVDKLVIVQGRVRMRDDRGVPQIWADRVLSFEGVERYLKAVVVDLPDGANDERLHRLVELAREHAGSAMLYLRRHNKDGQPRLVWVKEYKVALDVQFVLALRRLFGDDAIELRGELPSIESSRRYRRRPRRDGAA